MANPFPLQLVESVSENANPVQTNQSTTLVHQPTSYPPPETDSMTDRCERLTL